MVPLHTACRLSWIPSAGRPGSVRVEAAKSPTLLEPPPDGALCAWPVSRNVNSPPQQQRRAAGTHPSLIAGFDASRLRLAVRLK